jgi:Recombinase zinc beta ribbon domain
VKLRCRAPLKLNRHGPFGLKIASKAAFAEMPRRRSSPKRLIDSAEFEAVQTLLKSRSPAMIAPRIVSGPTLLTGICFCAGCGGAMTVRTGKSGRYRYYTCCTKARQGATGCPGRTVPMEKLDNLVAEYIEQRLLQPRRLEQLCRTYSIAAPSAPSDESRT